MPHWFGETHSNFTLAIYRRIGNRFRRALLIRLVVMMYVRFPMSLRNVEDLLFERGIDISYETVRLGSRHALGMAALSRCWDSFGPMSAADFRRQRVSSMRWFKHWNW